MSSEIQLGFEVAAGTTAEDLQADTSFVGALQTGFAASLSTDDAKVEKDWVSIDSITFVNRRRQLGRKLSGEQKTLKIAYTASMWWSVIVQKSPTSQ